MNPQCPFCKRETERISDNLAYEAWGCVPCKLYLNREKPKPPVEQTLAPISEIAIDKRNLER